MASLNLQPSKPTDYNTTKEMNQDKKAIDRQTNPVASLDTKQSVPTSPPSSSPHPTSPQFMFSPKSYIVPQSPSSYKPKESGEHAVPLHNAPFVGPGMPTYHLDQPPESPNILSQRFQGRVDKKLQSYGFIEPEDKRKGDQTQVFFHFSEFHGKVTDLQLGDHVEYSRSFDFRSQRWLAVGVIKVSNTLKITPEPLKGTVLTVAPDDMPLKTNRDRKGNISYEKDDNYGEMFYIPYSKVDLENEDQPVIKGQKVRFYIASDERLGHVWATRVAPITLPTKSRGVVCSLKENFGFIERADVVKEIFFHYSEYHGNIAEISLGDDVEFLVQLRQGKEVATSIEKLPEGTVTFETVSEAVREGRVTRVIRAAGRSAEPLAGELTYDNGTVKVLKYSERDVVGEFSLFIDDIVNFQVATDKRDKVQHATQVTLNEKTFSSGREQRMTGIVSSVKESYGFVQVHDNVYTAKYGDAQLFFHFNEIYRPNRANLPPVVVGDEIEFTCAMDPQNQQKPIAIRVKKLAKGTIKGNLVMPQHFQGVVVQDPPMKRDVGVIKYMSGKSELTVNYYMKDADLKYKDRVSFNVYEQRNEWNQCVEKKAVNIKLIQRLGPQYGFIASLKENFGFIEDISCEDEIFFHFSCCSEDVESLEVGMPVQYTLACRTKKVSAEEVSRADPSHVIMSIQSKVVRGQVIRSIRTGANSEREYSGKVKLDGDNGAIYPFGVISLVNRKTYPPVDSLVEFQIATMKDSPDRAVNVMIVKELVQGRVATINKGAFGFIDIDGRDKGLYFSVNDFLQGQPPINPGDAVQFVVGSSPHPPFKAQAFCIRPFRSTVSRKPSSNGSPAPRKSTFGIASIPSIPEARPERLINKLKQAKKNETEGPKLIVIRLPKRPEEDGLKPFAPRKIRAEFMKQDPKPVESSA